MESKAKILASTNRLRNIISLIWKVRKILNTKLNRNYCRKQRKKVYVGKVFSVKVIIITKKVLPCDYTKKKNIVKQIP